jgi:DNA-binding protein YbaB
MTSTVLVRSGSYRKQPVVNQKFTLVKGYQVGAKGGYITVKNEGQFNIDIEDVRVLVDNIEQIEYVTDATHSANDEVKVTQKETEEEAIKHCQEWNNSHNPGELSRKAEYTRY